MNSRYPVRPLGNVIHLDRDEVPVESTVSYRLAGMYSFGRGILEREPMNGSEMSYRSLFRLHEGTLVMSRLNGWEGAVAVVTKEHDGYFVSNEYPTFSIDQSLALPSYLALLCSWPQLWQALRERARGLGSDVGARRLRVHPEQLLATEVPLPDIEEQGRIVRGVDQLFAALTGLTQRASRSVVLDEALIDQAIDHFLDRLRLDGWLDQPLGEIAEINPKPGSRPVDDSVSFVAMAGVNDRTGLIQSFERRAPEEVATGYKQFKSGDVIFARITPCMQNGKSAVVRDLPTEVAYGSTEFHVIRPSNGVTADWIHRIVRTRSFRERAAARFQGTAGQQRVPASFLEEATIPIPPTPQAEADALVMVDGFLEKGGQLQTLRQRSLTLGKATRLAILNAVFGDATRLQS